MRTLEEFKTYYNRNNILTINADPKTIKGNKSTDQELKK